MTRFAAPTPLDEGDSPESARLQEWGMISNTDSGADPSSQTPSDRIADPEPAAATTTSGGRIRSAVAIGLGVLTIVVLIPTTIAVWAQRTVFDSDKVASIVGDALAEPEVSAALADYVTEQVFAAVDVDTVVSELLPAQLQRLAPVIADGARTAVDRALTNVMADPEVQAVLTEVVERAHRRAMQLLEGDGLVDGITVVDGEVTVNLLPLIGRGLTQLQQLGLFSDLEVPEMTSDGNPDEQIAALAGATGRDLPDDFGQLVVYQSEALADRQASLQSAQQVFAFAKRAVWVLVALTVVLLTATIVVARDRWRAVMVLGLSGIAAMVFIRSAVRRVVDEAPELAARPGGHAAIDAIVRGTSTGLLRLAGLLLIVAAAAVALALLRRRFRRGDLILVGAILLGVVVVAVLGISIVSLMVGMGLAIISILLARRYLPEQPPPPEQPVVAVAA